MTSTQNVEIAVSRTCCHQRSCTLPPVSEFFAIESRWTLVIHTYVSASTTTSTTGRTTSFRQVIRRG